jgi:hypothetical protein
MARTGPIPRRPELLRGHGSRAAREAQLTTITASGPSAPPFEADPNWRPEVRALFDSFAKGGVSATFLETDWQFLRITCSILSEALSVRNPRTSQLNGTLLTTALNALSRLGTTHADRLRLNLDIRPAAPEDTERTAIQASYRDLHLVPTQGADA